MSDDNVFKLIQPGTVNADRIFPKSAEVKFPTLAGAVVSSWLRRLQFSAAGLDASWSTGPAEVEGSPWS